MERIVVIIICIGLMHVHGCSQKSKSNLTVEDIEIFENTPAWELAQAVRYGMLNLSRIDNMLKEDPELANVQDPIYGSTLLMWAVAERKYKVCKILLEHGADPNIIAHGTGTTALYRAISFGRHDIRANKDAKYVKLLLDYGSDPNIVRQASEHNNNLVSSVFLMSPLMHSSMGGIEKSRLLVEAGADLEYARPTGETAVHKALLHGDVKLAHFLIVENDADITSPEYIVHWGYNNPKRGQIDSTDVRYPVDYLIEIVIFDLDSEEYALKKEIIDKFIEKGIDYHGHKKNVSENRLNQMKTILGDDWEGFYNVY